MSESTQPPTPAELAKKMRIIADQNTLSLLESEKKSISLAADALESAEKMREALYKILVDASPVGEDN